MNPRLKVLLIVLLAAVFVSGVYFLMMNSNPSYSNIASTTSETSTLTTTGKNGAVVKTPVKTGTKGTTGTPAAPAAGTPPTVLWSLHDKSNPRDTSALYTAVVVSTETDQFDLGTVPGICKTISDADLKGVGEISAIQCLNAGKGTEIGVFKQGNVYVVKSGSITNGEAGKPDTRGTFTIVHTLK